MPTLVEASVKALTLPVEGVKSGSLFLPAPSVFFAMQGAAGASEVDTVGGLVAAQSGGVGSAAGKIGNCRSFASASSQYLSVPNALPINLNVPSTIAGWFNLSTKTATQVLLHKGISNAATDREFIYFYFQGGNWMELDVYNGSGSNGQINTFSNPAVATWHCFCLKWDGVSIYGAVNGGAFTSAGYTLPQTTSAPLLLGSLPNATAFLNGNLDAVAIWRGILLTNAQWQNFYNGGVGREYSGGVWTP